MRAPQGPRAAPAGRRQLPVPAAFGSPAGEDEAVAVTHAPVLALLWQLQASDELCDEW